MRKLKLVTILGTRPEIIRLSEVIKCADRYFDHKLVHTGQNYDRTLNQVFFEDLKLREPDLYLDCVGENLGQTMGNIIAKSYEFLSKEKPDALLILGDTNSALCAISAKRLKIPIFHMEAGNRCWDWNVSEMINRKIVDHISDINLPYTEHSRRYLLSEGIDGKTVFVTGSPMKEVIKKHMEEIEASDVLAKLGLEKDRYILVSAHREENIDLEDNFMELMNSINEMAKTYDMPVIYSTHPRTRKFIEKRDFRFDDRVRNLEPFGYFDYNKLQKNAFVVLSDSGTLSEESAMLDFPAVLIRTSTERPEVLDKGTVVIGGIKSEDVLRAAALSRAMYDNGELTVEAEDYADENVSVKVVKLIESYAKIVDETVWLKH
ncbi:MAG: UDP-N-acetylglucosamine 2-epimerase (non-hydrolyzing) [Lachnospiraceae bacterium]|nr:UDP-N-acetylglucosamine 2-epimerase (non-hydrolyzing) [Lachnospiraceae bacterium]